MNEEGLPLIVLLHSTMQQQTYSLQELQRLLLRRPLKKNCRAKELDIRI